MKKILLTIYIVVSFLIIAGCSGGNIDKYQGHSSQDLYATAHKYMTNGDYTNAIDAYKSLIAQYPFEKKTKLGTLDLIYSYYKKGDSALALATANQFIKLFPDNKDIGYAYYIRGIVEYNNGRGFLQRRLPYSMEKHDPENYKKAFNSFALAIKYGTDAKYTNDARRRMIYISNIVAKYQYSIAKFNYEKKAYVGAINRAKIIVEKYPRSQSVEPALVLMIRAYNILGLKNLSDSSLLVLKKNFPNSSYILKLDKLKKAQSIRLN